MKQLPRNLGLRITVSPTYMCDKLVELGWETIHVQMVCDRIIALAEQDEDFLDVSRRLNPAKQIKLPLEPGLYEAHVRAVRESPALDRRLSARVRDERSRLRV